MRVRNLCAAALSLFALAGCQAAVMSSQTIAYNKAVADSTNEFFLLNVMRASDRYPLYYTRSTGNTSAATISPGAAISISNWHEFPAVTLGSNGGNALSLANLDDQKFMRGVLTPVSLSTLGFYLDQGWPKEVVLEMFIKSIEIDRSVATALAGNFAAHCGASGEMGTYCARRRPMAGDSVMPSPADYLSNSCMAGTAKVLTFTNDPSDPAASQCFRAALRVLIALGLNVQTGDKYHVIVADLPASAIHSLDDLSNAENAKLVISRRSDGNYAVCTKKDASAFSLDADALSTTGITDVASGFFDRTTETATTSIVIGPNLPQSCAEAAMARGDSGPRPVFKFTTRSLDSMLYYLGEDVRANSSVTIWSGHTGDHLNEIPLFLVQHGDGSALVSVDYRGSTIAIPDQCSGEPTCEQSHRSLQVLSLLNQIWGLQKEASEAPTVPVVSVIGDH